MTVDVVEVLSTPVDLVEVVADPVTIVEVVTEGPQGPAGPPGGSLTSYTPSLPAGTWIIDHSLGRIPHVTLVIDDELQDTDVEYPSTSRVVLTFAAPASGTAYLS